MKQLPFFMLGFYCHHVMNDLKKAKKLYKEAMRRTEFTLGSFNMLLAIYLHEFTFGNQDITKVRQKISALET